MTSKEIIKELRKEIYKILQTGKSLRSYRIYHYLDMLEKDNPTLSECIKEWKERGFKFIFNETFKNYITITNSYSINSDSNELEFNIDLKDKTLFMEGEYNSFPYDVVHLLSKTLKALEGMKDG